MLQYHTCTDLESLLHCSPYRDDLRKRKGDMNLVAFSNIKSSISVLPLCFRRRYNSLSYRRTSRFRFLLFSNILNINMKAAVTAHSVFMVYPIELRNQRQSQTDTVLRVAQTNEFAAPAAHFVRRVPMYIV